MKKRTKGFHSWELSMCVGELRWCHVISIVEVFFILKGDKKHIKGESERKKLKGLARILNLKKIHQ